MELTILMVLGGYYWRGIVNIDTSVDLANSSEMEIVRACLLKHTVDPIRSAGDKMPNDERKHFPREYIFCPAVWYPIIPTWRCDWIYCWTHKIVSWIDLFRLHRPIPIAGSFYQLGGSGGGVAGSKNPIKSEGFVGCLRQIYVDKLPAKVKRLSGFTLNSVFNV